MRKITVTDTLSLSIPERIVLVEDIWDSIETEADAIMLTDEEKEIIDERLEASRQAPNAASPWNEVYQRILEKHEA